MQVNDRVRHSGYAIRPKRDWWLSQGNTSRKNAAKESLDAFVAERGTVTELSERAVKVKWDNGMESHSLKYMVEVVE